MSFFLLPSLKINSSTTDQQIKFLETFEEGWSNPIPFPEFSSTSNFTETFEDWGLNLLLFEDFSSHSLNVKVDTDELLGNQNTYVKERILDNPGKRYAVLDSFAAGSNNTPFVTTKNSFTGILQLECTVLRNNQTTFYDNGGLNLEKPEVGEDLVLEYSFDGTNWQQYTTIMLGIANGSVAETVTEIQYSTEVDISNPNNDPFYLRFRETPDSGASNDHYAITDIAIYSRET